jgi:hypothetical protein
MFSIFSIKSADYANGQTITWKAFSSDELGVSLEMPNNWEVKENQTDLIKDPTS